MKLPLLFSGLIASAAMLPGAHAQSTDWTTVRQLPPGQQIRVTDQSHSDTCFFLGADEVLLRCEHRRTVLFFFTLREQSAFYRDRVLVVRNSRRAVSGVAGGAIGVAAGAGLGAGLDAQAQNQAEEGHLLTFLLGVLGGYVGAAIGSHTDFLAGPVIYRKP